MKSIMKFHPMSIIQSVPRILEQKHTSYPDVQMKPAKDTRKALKKMAVKIHGKKNFVWRHALEVSPKTCLKQAYFYDFFSLNKCQWKLVSTG